MHHFLYTKNKEILHMIFYSLVKIIFTCQILKNLHQYKTMKSKNYPIYIISRIPILS